MSVKTLQEIAKVYGINDGTLRVSVNKGRLPASKSGGTWLIDTEDPQVKAYLENFQHKENKRMENKPACPVCGQPVPRARAKYCSQECYAKTYSAAFEVKQEQGVGV